MAKRILKRTVFLWGLPTLLVAVVLVLMFGRPLFRGATSFGFPNANKVRHIVLNDGAQHMELDRHSGRWYINNGDEMAQQDKVADALYALQMLEVKYPLPTELTDAIPSSGLRVMVSGWLGSLRGYTLYKVDSLLVGVVREGKPYVLQVRGNEELDIFSLLDANALSWRKTLLVNLLPTQIASVAVEDLGNPERSFTLSVDTLGNAELLEMYSGTEHTRLDMDHVKRYLSYYRGLSVERYATELSEDDAEAILMGDAAYMITITNREGVTQVIKLYYIPVGDELDAFGRPTKVDLNRCYLQQDDDTHLAVALWVDFDILLKDMKFFRK